MAERQIPIGASSNVQAVHYDDSTQTLRVNFLDGSQYTYHEVPSNVADGFSTAQSPGKYVFQALRGQYLHKKIG